MRNKGLLGIALLVAFSAAMSYLIRAGGHFETTAKVMIAILGFMLGWNGVARVIEASKVENTHTCYLCGTECRRYCDFQMAATNGDGDHDCGRWACHLHMHLSEDGKRDYCDDHHQREGLLP